MSENFKALVLNQDGENFTREIKSIDKSFLKHGDVTVKVHYSGLNYKDALILKNGARLVKEFPHIPGIDFSGVVEEVDEGDEIAKALGDKKVAILQNHGILTTGPSVDIALWFYMSMERCCQAQLMAEAAGKPISVSHETAVKTREFIANDIAAWASYQPAFDKIVKMQPDLLD